MSNVEERRKQKQRLEVALLLTILPSHIFFPSQIRTTFLLLRLCSLIVRGQEIRREGDFHRFLCSEPYYMISDYKEAAMTINSYQDQAELLLKEYFLADPFIPYTSVIGGIIACKMVYDLAQVFNAVYFNCYSKLSEIDCIEWNNRALSTVHAVFITIMSLYLVFWSDLFSDQLPGLVTYRSSLLSTVSLGISAGYFLADLGMIIWLYPSLGRMEYMIHHVLSMTSLAYAMLTSEGQIYTYMVLISETTTPAINLRWYLDKAGMKRSRAYVINGVAIFFAWLVARILLFMYLFYHLYLHIEQIRTMQTFGQLLALIVPFVLAVMNLMWFGKIIKGLKKTLANKRQ